MIYKHAKTNKLLHTSLLIIETYRKLKLIKQNINLKKAYLALEKSLFTRSKQHV